MKKTAIRNLTTSAMFMAAGLVLPFFTGQIPQIGNMLLPMHIPVLLCGFICGWQYGLIVGFLLPLVRYVLFGMPMLFPTGIAMAFELATYGFVSGWLYSRSKWKCIVALYQSLIMAMLTGRIVWAIVRMVMLGVTGLEFSWAIFATEAFVNAIPGIILQLVFIPAFMVALKRTGMVHFYSQQHKECKHASERK